MALFLTAVMAGLAIGSIYALVALGFTVPFNATRVFNLAQGDLVMVGIMMSYYALDVLRLPQLMAVFVVVAAVGMIAALEERTVVRPFLNKPGRASFGWFIATLGFSAVIESTVNVLFGHHDVVSIPSPLPRSGIHLGSSVIGYQQLLVIGTLGAVTIVLELFYGRTWTGQAMRGAAEDREAASLMGVDPVVMSRSAFIIAGVIGGVAGCVIAPITFSNPAVGLGFTLKGFIALAIGGFGSVRGAVAGGLALGVGEQIFDAYGSSDYEVLVGALLLLLVLSVRPEGLFRTTAARTV